MIVFVSMPSKGLFRLDDTTKRWIMKDQVRIALVKLHQEMSDAVFIAPSIQNYDILPFMDESIGPTYESWKNRCRQLIGVSDLVVVLKAPGWDESVGVKDEIEYATQNRCKVIYIDW